MSTSSKDFNSNVKRNGSSGVYSGIKDDGKNTDLMSTRNSWNLSPIRSMDASIITRHSTSSPLSSSFAMVHELCADATHHAHALDVKFGHVLYQAEEERKAAVKIQKFYHKRYVSKNLAAEREKRRKLRQFISI